jgi:hypothetical protein
MLNFYYYKTSRIKSYPKKLIPILESNKELKNR